jgi:hypothetical protein
MHVHKANFSFAEPFPSFCFAVYAFIMSEKTRFFAKDIRTNRERFWFDVDSWQEDVAFSAANLLMNSAYLKVKAKGGGGNW